MENDLITIVVPVYNVEKYLETCINSILCQTYKMFELILVNDGSTDSSGKICDKYKEKDSRIIVIHQENGGLSDARNKGIDIAKGKYITFIDSDDFVKEKYLEYLLDLIKRYNTMISICAYSVIMPNGKNIDIGKGYKECLLNKKNSFERMLNEEGFSVSAWAKLYDLSLFKSVRYPFKKLCEDNGTTYKLLDQVEYVAYGAESQYYYLKREGSIMQSKFNEKKLDMIYLTDEMCDYLDKKYPEIKEYTIRRRIYARFNILRQLMFDENNIKLENDLINYILEHKKYILCNDKVPKRDKIALITLMFGKRFFKVMWRLYCKIKY